MKNKNIFIIFVFALAGTLFSGYLTFAKLFLGSCSLAEGCSYFLGYPSCAYGFVMFFILLVSSAYLLVNGMDKKGTPLKAIFYVSIIGVLFSLYSTIQDVFFSSCPAGGCTYSMLLPTCVYGLVMYAIILAVSYVTMRSVKR